MVEAIFSYPDRQKPALCRALAGRCGLFLSQAGISRQVVAGAEVLGSLRREACLPTWQGQGGALWPLPPPRPPAVSVESSPRSLGTREELSGLPCDGRPWVHTPPRAAGLLEQGEASKHRVLLLSTPGESRMLRSGSPDTALGRKVNPKTVEMPQV